MVWRYGGQLATCTFPHNYCGLPNILLDKLERVQNSAARLISGVPRRARMTPVLKDLHWLPIRQRILFKICVMVFKAMTDCAPQYIVDLLVRHNPSRRLRSSDGNFLVIPSARTTHYGERRFSNSAPVAWNNQSHLHLGVEGVNSKSLLRHLFNIAFVT